jgi:hypothetical protein
MLMDAKHIHELLSDVAKEINSGNIATLPRDRLEQFAAALCNPLAPLHFSGSLYAQVCETVRLGLIVRISEDNNAEATRISKIALRISSLALVIGLIQTLVSVTPLFH